MYKRQMESLAIDEGSVWLCRSNVYRPYEELDRCLREGWHTYAASIIDSRAYDSYRPVSYTHLAGYGRRLKRETEGKRKKPFHGLWRRLQRDRLEKMCIRDRNHLGVMELLALRWTVSALLFLILIALRVVKVSYKGKNVKLVLLVGVLQPCIYAIFETLGIKYTTTSELSLLPIYQRLQRISVSRRR